MKFNSDLEELFIDTYMHILYRIFAKLHNSIVNRRDGLKFLYLQNYGYVLKYVIKFFLFVCLVILFLFSIYIYALSVYLYRDPRDPMFRRSGTHILYPWLPYFARVESFYKFYIHFVDILYVNLINYLVYLIEFIKVNFVFMVVINDYLFLFLNLCYFDLICIIKILSKGMFMLIFFIHQLYLNDIDILSEIYIYTTNVFMMYSFNFEYIEFAKYFNLSNLRYFCVVLSFQFFYIQLNFILDIQHLMYFFLINYEFFIMNINYFYEILNNLYYLLLHKLNMFFWTFDIFYSNFDYEWFCFFFDKFRSLQIIFSLCLISINIVIIKNLINLLIKYFINTYIFSKNDNLVFNFFLIYILFFFFLLLIFLLCSSFNNFLSLFLFLLFITFVLLLLLLLFYFIL